MMGDWGSWGWGVGFGWIFMILSWALILLGLAALAKWIFSAGDSGGGFGGPGKSALDVLKKRYARGEINRGQPGGEDETRKSPALVVLKNEGGYRVNDNRLCL